MKATELKIGDWVSYKGMPAKVDVYVPPVLYFEGESTSTVLADSDLRPIPLTEEILKKNGWISQKAPYKMYLQYRKKGNPTLDEWGNGYHFSCGNRTVDIKYVHEIQHILWALGINDYLNI